MSQVHTFSVGQRVAFTDPSRHPSYLHLAGKIGTVVDIDFEKSAPPGEEQIVTVEFDTGERESMFNKRLSLEVAAHAEPTGKELKAEGQSRSRKRAGSDWLAKSLDKFKEYCEGEYINGNQDVDIDGFRARGLVPEPASVFAWGSLPRAAVKAGFIRPTNLVRNATRPQAHARPIKLWNIVAEGL